jgi:tetratricopeptide (TPR) repeat protein
MYNLLIALAAGVLVALVVRLLGFPLWAGLVPGTIVLLGTYLLLARRVSTRLQALATAAQKELSVQPANARERQARVDKAIKTLEEGFGYARWQFLIAAEIHAQIGMIKYVMRDLDGAEPHLAKASPRNYMAKALQGALFYQRKDHARMRQSFEAAVKSGKKEGLVWAAYAWCLLQLKEKDAALKVMSRAVQANPTDEKLKSGLTALQNDKKLKMKPYEPMWWQFGLEQPPMPVFGGGGGGGRRIQFVRR